MRKTVVLTGAGISAESGLKTFRDGDGLWENYRVEDVATISAWHANPDLVLRFYNERRTAVMKAKPNSAHFLLAELQNHADVQVITQNVDDLHERAGSRKVLHLHGEIMKMRSVKNDAVIYPTLNEINLGDEAKDGGQLRPHIVWFGELVPMMEKAIPLVEAADVFIVIGTSLLVYPAAGLLSHVRKDVEIINIDTSTPDLSGFNQVYSIKKTATEGMKDLFHRLRIKPQDP